MLIRIVGMSGGVDPDPYDHWVNPDQIAYSKPCSTNDSLWFVRVSGVEDRHQVITVTAKEHKNMLKLINNK